jgi:hypothetical protein
MTAFRPSTPGERRVPELRPPFPFLEYLLQLPGDYAKLTLRLLQRSQWVPGVARHGVPVDAGEVLVSMRSRDLWGAVRLDREVGEAGRVSLLRRVLRRLERDGLAATRAAQRSDTPADTGRATRRDTPATIVRFLKYRDILWPAAADTTREATQGAARASTQKADTIPSRDPAVPAGPEGSANAAALPLEDGPRIADVRAVLAMAASAYEDITGSRYQHAQPPALKADRRAAADLLAVADGIEAIETVWRSALRQSDWPRIETLADLARHWARVAPRALTATRANLEARPARIATGCPEWERLVSTLQRRLRPDLFERWFAPLEAVVEGLGRRLKSGQRWTGQNRPTARTRDRFASSPRRPRSASQPGGSGSCGDRT